MSILTNEQIETLTWPVVDAMRSDDYLSNLRLNETFGKKVNELVAAQPKRPR